MLLVFLAHGISRGATKADEQLNTKLICHFCVNALCRDGACSRAIRNGAELLTE